MFDGKCFEPIELDVRLSCATQGWLQLPKSDDDASNEKNDGDAANKKNDGDASKKKESHLHLLQCGDSTCTVKMAAYLMKNSEQKSVIWLCRTVYCCTTLTHREYVWLTLHCFFLLLLCLFMYVWTHMANSALVFFFLLLLCLFMYACKGPGYNTSSGKLVVSVLKILIVKYQRVAMYIAYKYIYCTWYIHMYSWSLTFMDYSSSVNAILIRVFKYNLFNYQYISIPIVHSRWVDQWKNANNLAILHALDTKLALIDCAWKCACYT